jgi:uncharacterized protein (DUF2147 family)
LIAGALCAGSAQADGLADLSGHWRTSRHGALVHIGDCGNGTPCGRLAWVDERVSGGVTRDLRNQDPTLRVRGLIGLHVLWGFAAAHGGWRDGRLYNPDDGKTFRAHLSQISPTELRVTGCLGPLCRSEVWTRSGSESTTGERP